MNLRSPIPLFLTLSSTLVLNACQSIDPTIYECQTLLETINGVVVEAQTLTQAEQSIENQDPNLDIWLQAADVLDQGAQTITELSIESTVLQSYQTQIGEVYSEQAQATYDMVKAWQNKDLKTALSAQTRTKEAGALEQSTGEALNNYCQEKQQEIRSDS